MCFTWRPMIWLVCAPAPRPAWRAAAAPPRRRSGPADCAAHAPASPGTRPCAGPASCSFLRSLALGDVAGGADPFDDLAIRRRTSARPATSVQPTLPSARRTRCSSSKTLVADRIRDRPCTSAALRRECSRRARMGADPGCCSRKPPPSSSRITLQSGTHPVDDVGGCTGQGPQPRLGLAAAATAMHPCGHVRGGVRDAQDAAVLPKIGVLTASQKRSSKTTSPLGNGTRIG
jgi:hypothetical protein